MEHTSKYKEKFVEVTGIKEGTLSTVDHVFSSIPIRLLDSHRILSDMKDVKILVWDNIFPSSKRYRSELQLDTGIMSVERPEYYFFDPHTLYGQSSVIWPALDRQISELRCLLEMIINVKGKKRIIDTYLDRLDTLIALYKKSYAESDGTATDFYRKLVVFTYRHLGFDTEADFFEAQSVSLMNTNIFTEFLPWLIEETWNETVGLPHVAAQLSAFSLPYFRSIHTDDTDDITTLDNNCEYVTALLRKGAIMPAKEVMYWMFALLGIKHFGQSFGFFEAFEEFCKSKGYSDCTVSELQLTEGKNDGAYFVEFEKDTSYRLVDLNGKKKTVKIVNPQKPSSVSTVTSVYLHTGNTIKEIYKKYRKENKITKTKMGEVTHEFIDK